MYNVRSYNYDVIWVVTHLKKTALENKYAGYYIYQTAYQTKLEYIQSIDKHLMSYMRVLKRQLQEVVNILSELLPDSCYVDYVVSESA